MKTDLKENKEIPTETLKGWEFFCDPSYYHMYAVRKIGVTKFDETMHVSTRQIAIDVIKTITEEKEILLQEIKQKFGEDPYWNYKGLGEFIDKKLLTLK